MKSNEIKKRHIINEKTGKEYFIYRVGDMAWNVTPELEQDPLIDIEGYIRGQLALQGLSEKVDEFNEQKKKETI